MNRVLVVGMFVCLAILLAAPFAVGVSFAKSKSYSLVLGSGTCGSPSVSGKTETVACNVPAPGRILLGRTTDDTSVHDVLYSFSGPGGSGSGTVGCKNTASVVTCGSFSFPTTSAGKYSVVLEFVTQTNSFTVKMDATVSVFVAPEFPLGTLVAAIAPIGGLGLFLAVKKGRPSLR